MYSFFLIRTWFRLQNHFLCNRYYTGFNWTPITYIPLLVFLNTICSTIIHDEGQEPFETWCTCWLYFEKYKYYRRKTRPFIHEVSGIIFPLSKEGQFLSYHFLGWFLTATSMNRHISSSCAHCRYFLCGNMRWLILLEYHCNRLFFIEKRKGFLLPAPLPLLF